MVSKVRGQRKPLHNTYCIHRQVDNLALATEEATRGPTMFPSIFISILMLKIPYIYTIQVDQKSLEHLIIIFPLNLLKYYL